MVVLFAVRYEEGMRVGVTYEYTLLHSVFEGGVYSTVVQYMVDMFTFAFCARPNKDLEVLCDWFIGMILNCV